MFRQPSTGHATGATCGLLAHHLSSSLKAATGDGDQRENGRPIKGTQPEKPHEELGINWVNYRIPKIHKS